MPHEPLTIELNEVPHRTKDSIVQQVRRPLLTQSPSHPDDYILSIDHSSLEQFNVCARKAEYALVQKRQPVRNTSALSYGSAIHRALETSLRVGTTERNSREVVQKQNGDIIAHFGQNPIPMDEWRTADRAIDTLNKYRKQFETDVFDVLEINGKPMVEVPFRLPLGTVEMDTEVLYPRGIVCAPIDPPILDKHQFFVRNIHILWSGRIDAIIIMDGRIWVMDHKTSSISGQTFKDQFYLSAQTIGYTWAAQELLRDQWKAMDERYPTDVSGLLLNGIISRRPSKTGVANEFIRQRYHYDSWQLDEWKHNTLTLVSDFLSHLARGFFPQQTAWCINKYGRCPYFETCQLPTKQRATYLASNLFEDVTWSPLDNRE